MFKKVLVVCYANICRSPAAEALLKDKLAAQHVEVRSAGIQAMPGMPASTTMSELMLEKGFDLSQHQSTHLDQPLTLWSDLVLVMETSHQKFIESQFPAACGRVHLLGRWSCGEIADPYRQAREKYQTALEQLEQAVDAWDQKIWRNASV